MGFFKAYDMRGTFGADFDLDTVYRVGRALPKVVKGRRWLVGRDCRTTSDAVRDSLVLGLAESGVAVYDIGRSTTPMVYFFTAEDGFDGSVMVTASHNPPTDNGLKVSKATSLPVGYADGLGEVERLVKSDAGQGTGDAKPDAIPVKDALGRYIAWQKERAGDFSNLKFAVDCSNGMASIFAREMFPGALLLNDSPDGAFPCHSPNPLKAEAREQLAKAVRENGLDCGVIFDGDADRAMFVDENGEFVQPDYLVPVVARATRRAHSPESSNGSPLKIIHDVRTSRGAVEALREDGFEPVMVPVGHAFAKPILRKVGALCGGELAGHYYFSEFFGCDSGLLAATRILSEVARAKARGMPFSAMMRPIVSRYANSGEMNFRVEDKDAAIARVLDASKSFGAETGRSDMDGVRLEFADGWVSVRKSNTEPYLRLLVECDSKDRLSAWIDVLRKSIEG
jgi:phosphomannomutase